MTSSSPADSASAFTRSVSQQFATRPTFERVAQHMLEQAITAKYPSLVLDLSSIQLGPSIGSSAGDFNPLMPRVLDYLALGTPVGGQDQQGQVFLSQNVPNPLLVNGKKLDLTAIEPLIADLPLTLPIGLESALTDYWNATIDSDRDNSISRWAWFSDSLKNLLHTRALQQPGLTEPERDALDQLVNWPERDQRFSRNLSPVYAYSLETVVVHGGISSVLPSNDLLLQHFTSSGLVILLCSPGREVQSFKSTDAFLEYRGQQIARRYTVDTVTCQYNEISGNAFDTQAMLTLEQQLIDLKAIQLPAQIGLQDLSRLYNELSDPARFLRDAPCPAADTSAPLQSLLPEWLKKASIVDQTKFQHYSLTLASARRRSQGRTFLSDIPDIERFTAHALLERMQQVNNDAATKSQASHYQPDDVELTFSVGAGYPGTIGIVTKKTMSLTELAINNLVARPSGHFELSHRKGLLLPTWLTPDLITRKGGLIEQADVGTTYPLFLQQALLDDATQAVDRLRLFAEQLPSQLALEALNRVQDSENAMTPRGFDLVEALLKPDAVGQQVDGTPVLMRHLSFLRKAEARPDTVTNMFLIEYQGEAPGPHLLYRPLYTPSLLEFPTREALLRAIAAPGKLQDSVLTWMPDAARPIYDNGGFLEPHIVRFFQGDEFTLPEKPAPATIANGRVNDELLQYLRNGALMQYLYGCNVRALVSQADRSSVSNSESRWAVLMEGGSVLFNTLLAPLLRGPAMAAAWLWGLMASASRDIPALNSEDLVTRELAVIDLLVNLSMLVSQFRAINAPVPTPVSETLQEQTLRSPAPLAIPERWPSPPAPDIVSGTVALPGEYSQAAGGVLDLRFSSARHRLTPEMRTRLTALQVRRPTLLPAPLVEGPFKGAYLIGGKQHVLVENNLYQARLEPDGSATIIDPLDPTQNGPALKTDGQGNWSMDLRLRLRGGMPLKRIAALQKHKIDRLNELRAELDAYASEQPDKQLALTTALAVLDKSETMGVPPEKLAIQRERVTRLIEEQIAINQKLLDNAPEYARLHLELPPGTVHLLMENLVKYGRRAMLMTEMERVALTAANRRYTGDVASVQQAATQDTPGYMKYLDELSLINDKAIRWLDLTDRYLEALLNLDASGARTFERLTEDRSPNERNAITTKLVQLPVLASLVFKRFDSDLPEYLHRIIQPLTQQLRTHSDLRIYELNATERLELLESLTQHYGEALDALKGMQALDAGEINAPYSDRLVALVQGLYEDVHARLAAEVKPEPRQKVRPPKQAKALPGKPQKKVIKTRKNGVLIGDLQTVGTDTPIETVELRSDVDDQVIATYTQHDDVWDIVEVRRPVPPPKTRSLRAIRGDARTLLEQLDERMHSAQSYKSHCRFPQEIEEILVNEASRFDRLGAELDRAIAASQAPGTSADQALAGRIADASAKLIARGQDLRVELSLKLPPTEGTVRFLFEKNLIQVALLDSRKPMRGARKDFLQEYAINDRDGWPIWYVHFHYEKVDTPKMNYSVAHLKTREQRTASYYSMLADARTPYAVVDVYRARIGESLATSKFLPLAP